MNRRRIYMRKNYIAKQSTFIRKVMVVQDFTKKKKHRMEFWDISLNRI